LKDDEQPQRFGVQLAEPLLAADGSVAFPAGTQLIAKMNAIAESGMVQLAIVAVIAPTAQGNKLINVPAGAILIAGKDGKPLMAKNYKPNRHRIARMDAQIALMGALGQVGTLLNRPQNESTTTSPYLSSTSITNGRSDILGGLLQGGFNTLLGQAQQRQQQEIQTLLQRPHIWFVPAGQAVQVFVNSSFQVPL
jgi:Bacterial conjugation TrbI-like protein